MFKDIEEGQTVITVMQKESTIRKRAIFLVEISQLILGTRLFLSPSLYYYGETTILVPQVYLVCAIGPLSFN